GRIEIARLARLVGLLDRRRIVVALGRRVEVGPAGRQEKRQARAPERRTFLSSLRPPRRKYCPSEYQNLAVTRNKHRNLLAHTLLVHNQTRLGQRRRDRLEDIRQLRPGVGRAGDVAGGGARIELARVGGDRLHGRAGGVFRRVAAFRAAAAGAAGRSRSAIGHRVDLGARRRRGLRGLDGLLALVGGL